MLTIPALIAKVETMSDGGMKIVINTNEIPVQDKAELMGFHQKFGWFLFGESPVQDSDIPEETIEFEGQKSPSERLRNVLYILHEKRGGKPEDFNDFRNRYMEKLINNIKSKIDDYE